MDAEQLAVALKDAGEEIREKVIPNLTQKAKKQMDDLQQKMTDIKHKDVQAMRKKVEEKLKKIF